MKRLAELLSAYAEEGTKENGYAVRVGAFLKRAGHTSLTPPLAPSLRQVLLGYSPASQIVYKAAWENWVSWLGQRNILWPSLKEARACVLARPYEAITALYLGLGKPEWSVFAALARDDFEWDAQGVLYHGQRLEEPTRAALLQLINWGQGSCWLHPTAPNQRDLCPPDELRKELLSWRDKTLREAQAKAPPSGTDQPPSSETVQKPGLRSTRR